VIRLALLVPPNLGGDSGSAVYARLQAKALAGRGLDVNVLAGRDVPLDGVRVCRTPVPIPHPTAEHDTPVSDRAYLETLTALVRRLLGLHHERALDVVHAFYSTFTGYAACTFQALTGVPAIVSCLGRDVNPGMPPAPIAARLTASVIRQARHLLASNEATKVHVSRLLGDGGGAEVGVVPMGVDDTLFDPGRFSASGARAALGWPRDAFVVMTVASHMLPEKQVELVVEAAFPLLAEHPSARLVVVGPPRDGGTGAVRRMRARVAAAGCRDEAIFAGPQPHERIPLYLAAADVVVDARCADNFSSSLLEAVAMGRTVVVSGTALRQLGGTAAGFRSFPDGDCRALAEALRGLLENPGERSSLTGTARAWWAANRQRLSLDATTGELVRIYDAALTARALGS
jgi:glycosyltransferase involved in cell wall biosynthesis